MQLPNQNIYMVSRGVNSHSKIGPIPLLRVYHMMTLKPPPTYTLLQVP